MMLTVGWWGFRSRFSHHPAGPTERDDGQPAPSDQVTRCSTRHQVGTPVLRRARVWSLPLSPS